jgi:CBS domain-containing protein
MRVSEAMTKNVKIANPDQSIKDAARLMVEIDAGILPIGGGRGKAPVILATKDF